MFEKAKRMAAEPAVTIPMALFAYFAWGGIDRYVLDGDPVTDILQWLWATISTFMDKPLVQLAMVPLAIWLFYKGIRRIERKEELETAHRDDSLAAETRMRDKALEDVRLAFAGELEAFRNKLEQNVTFSGVLASAYMIDKVCDPAATAYERLESLISDYKKAVNGLTSGVIGGRRRELMVFEDLAAMACPQLLDTAYALDVPMAEPGIEQCDASFLDENGEIDSVAKGAYIQTQQRNLVRLEKGRDLLKPALMKVKRDTRWHLEVISQFVTEKSVGPG